MSFEQYKTQVLLLHSQQSTLDVLSAGFTDRFSVHCATSGTEALNTFHDTPIHVFVSAHKLPGMSGLEAIREARKRSPDTIGILLAGDDKSDGLEAMVGEKEVFQVVRGEVQPADLIKLIENAQQTARLMTLAESANDKNADVDMPAAEHIVMETSEHGATIISDGTGTMPALKLKPEKVATAPGVGARGVDVLVLTKDEEFLATIKDSSGGLHNVHHSVTPAQAEDTVANHKIGVLVTDAAMVGSDVEGLTRKLRVHVPRLVAIVAGRRDDGDMLMDLINRGHVYRFLLKPVSPGRARLAIEASVKHHLEAPDSAFKSKPKAAAPRPAATPKPVAKAKPVEIAKPKPAPKPAPVAQRAPAKKPAQASPPQAISRKTAQEKIEPVISTSPLDDIPLEVDFDGSPGDDKSFTDTMTDIAVNVGKSISGATENAQNAVRSSGAAVADLAGKVKKRSLANAGLLGIAAAAVAAVGLAGWLLLGGETTPDKRVAASDAAPQSGVSRTVTPPVQQPRTTEAQERAAATATAVDPAPVPEPVAEVAVSPQLAAAREARDSGRLIAPAGNNAVELYIDARDAQPGNAAVTTELSDVVDEVLAVAEGAILARDAEEAAAALAMVERADAGNARLTFLSAQLAQLQLRQTTEDARIAIRDGRFGDAGTLIAKAEFLAGADAAEIELLRQELTAAQNARQAGEMIAQANQRLEAGNLVSPCERQCALPLPASPGDRPGEPGSRAGAHRRCKQTRAPGTHRDRCRRVCRRRDPACRRPQYRSGEHGTRGYQQGARRCPRSCRRSGTSRRSSAAR